MRPAYPQAGDIAHEVRANDCTGTTARRRAGPELPVPYGAPGTTPRAGGERAASARRRRPRDNVANPTARRRVSGAALAHLRGSSTSCTSVSRPASAVTRM
ncbi:hypothetical protein KVA01_11130 [Kocuria varians]|uniref:Uncharacterized protein n=1 Tax=Kocuria varians TaxID=1272 RepID=A0A4Y4D1A5_KOCVA|nr:hypothetical protein KVA01_11130 [Kocuria varians]